MTFLAKEQNKEEYLMQMTQLSKSARIQSKYVLQRFDNFCSKVYDRTEDQVVQELKMVKKTQADDEYKDYLFNKIAQPFIDELSKVYDPVNVKVLFSYFKRYLVWSGIVIYREESKIHLRFPKKSKDEKHILTKDEVRAICNVASPKRRMMYLVLASSTMRIAETVQLRKRDIEVKDGKVTNEIYYMNASEEEWGEESLIAAAKSCAGRTAEEIAHYIFGAADQFVAGASQFDDMTLVVLKVLNPC